MDPKFDLDPALVTQLEGLLSGVAFSGIGKKAATLSTGDLEKLALSSFNIVEIISFVMAAIAIIESGLDKVNKSCKGPALSALAEFRPFLGSVDKACRHIVREALSLMSTFVMKQRTVLASCFSAALPKSFRAKLIKSPLSSFEVGPKETFAEVKRQYDAFVQNKAFASAVANVGATNRFKTTSRVFKKRLTIVARGSRGRGQVGFQRGTFAFRGNRGQFRGPLRGVRRSSMAGRNARGFARRDRAIREIDNQQRGNASTNTTVFSPESQL